MNSNIWLYQITSDLKIDKKNDQELNSRNLDTTFNK